MLSARSNPWTRPGQTGCCDGKKDVQNTKFGIMNFHHTGATLEIKTNWSRKESGFYLEFRSLEAFPWFRESSETAKDDIFNLMGFHSHFRVVRKIGKIIFHTPRIQNYTIGVNEAFIDKLVSVTILNVRQDFIIDPFAEFFHHTRIKQAKRLVDQAFGVCTT